MSIMSVKEQPVQCFNYYVPDFYTCAVRVWRFETSYRLDLSADSNIFNVEDLRKSKISYLASMFDFNL